MFELAIMVQFVVWGGWPLSYSESGGMAMTTALVIGGNKDKDSVAVTLQYVNAKKGAPWLLRQAEPLNITCFDNDKKEVRAFWVLIPLPYDRVSDWKTNISYNRLQGASWIRIELGASPLRTPLIRLP